MLRHLASSQWHILFQPPSTFLPHLRCFFVLCTPQNSLTPICSCERWCALISRTTNRLLTLFCLLVFYPPHGSSSSPFPPSLIISVSASQHSLWMSSGSSFEGAVEKECSSTSSCFWSAPQDLGRQMWRTHRCCNSPIRLDPDTVLQLVLRAARVLKTCTMYRLWCGFSLLSVSPVVGFTFEDDDPPDNYDPLECCPSLCLGSGGALLLLLRSSNILGCFSCFFNRYFLLLFL